MGGGESELFLQLAASSTEIRDPGSGLVKLAAGATRRLGGPAFRVARHDGGVTVSHAHSLIIAAAQAAGPCPPGLEAAWHSRVRALALDLHLDGVQLAADIDLLEKSKHQVRGLLLSVEVEPSNNRGKITVRALDRDSPEHFSTQRLETDAGKELFDRAQRLVGRLVRIYKYLDVFGEGQDIRKSRMAAHIVDLGPADGAVPEKDAKDMVLQGVGGNTAKAKELWQAAGLPDGRVDIAKLEQVLAGIRTEREPDAG